MTMAVNCRDVGFDCKGVIRAKAEEEAMAHAAGHAKEVHSLQEITPEI